MTTHNALIYHCAVCGRVEHAELEAAQPQCCGRAMDKACAETVRGGELEDKATDYSGSNLPDTEASRKPR
jgi:hypothetical protein